ncbi:unnamed protein product [Miscanthus lutarioriparius]|uniref:Trichome birefringence-like N-terminal domain-containing protein n=1 Tax=Miscanthus lutarioriparius TaxID=422564 RepID=A0A811N5S9_9POAL|nr:unnamed protein product [Miscanthus lutarioriparius]
MEMASARRRAKLPQAAGGGDQQLALWAACVLLSSLSLLIAAASSGLGGAARFTLTLTAGQDREAGALVMRATGAAAVRGAAGDGRRYCDEDDDLIRGMSVDGEWVLRDADESERHYGPGQCPFVDEGFRCRENGRPDGQYAEWAWRPRRCALPRFDAARLLGILRNRRLVFVGDSIGRNQWESMLCMLASAVADDDGKQGGAIYEENGSPITKHKGFLSFRFRDYNCTVEHYRSPYLVRRGRPPRRSPKHVVTTLQLGAMDPRAPRWKDADILVFNTGHWWNQERLHELGCYFQDGKTVRLNMSVEDAYQRALKTLQKWVQKEVNTTKTLVVLRTYSPAHVSRASNGSGGWCGRETVPEQNTSRIALHRWPGLLNPSPAFIEAAAAAAAKKQKKKKRRRPVMHVLNVTLMTAQRRDGHPSVYNVVRLPSPAGVQAQQEQVMRAADCSHWCLPGVPDAWNQLLYALILRSSMSGGSDWIGATP